MPDPRWLVPLLLCLGAPVRAQPQAVCAAWAKPAVARMAAASPDAPPVLLTASVPAEVTLHPLAHVRFAATEGSQRGPDGTHAGLVTIRVPKTGRWWLSASAPLWIDVVGPHGLLPLAGREPVLPCTDLRKTLPYELAQGDWLVQLSASRGAVVRLLLSPAP